jgi:hypothetical protein
LYWLMMIGSLPPFSWSILALNQGLADLFDIMGSYAGLLWMLILSSKPWMGWLVWGLPVHRCFFKLFTDSLHEGYSLVIALGWKLMHKTREVDFVLGLLPLFALQ